MLLWLILAVMTGAAALVLLWPLARRGGDEQRPSDADFYRAAVADIERDAARGLIGDAEAAAAKTEAARRLLRSEPESARESGAGDAARRRRLASALALVAVPVIALTLYGFTGSPDLPDAPLAARGGVDPAQIDIAEAVARIEAHLSRNPNDGAGYDVIAPVYFRIGRLDDAVRAFQASLRLNGEAPDRLANLGEALTARAGGVVTADAKAQFDRAAALDAKHAKARYYLALAREQDGDRAGAAAAFEALIAAAPADAPWLDAVRERLARLRGAPAGGEAVAALPDAQRMAVIRAMVDGLADRLATNGGSLEDWSRLVRSHMVLGDKDKALRALADARRALGDSAAAQLDALSRELGLGS